MYFCHLKGLSSHLPETSIRDPVFGFQQGNSVAKAGKLFFAATVA